jgi:hypothetical protein
MFLLFNSKAAFAGDARCGRRAFGAAARDAAKAWFTGERNGPCGRSTLDIALQPQIEIYDCGFADDQLLCDFLFHYNIVCG